MATDKAAAVNKLLQSDSVVDIVCQKPYEPDEHYNERRAFLENLLRGYLAETDGDPATFHARLPRIAVLSSCFYNIKVLGCCYPEEIHTEIVSYDPSETSYAIRATREQHLAKCIQKGFQVELAFAVESSE